MKGWSTPRQLRSGNRGSRARGRGAHAHGSTATFWLRKAEPDRTVSRRLSIRSALSASSVPRAPTTPSSVGTIDHLPMMVSLRSPRCRGRRWSASSGGLRVPFREVPGSSPPPWVPRHAPESCQTRVPPESPGCLARVDISDFPRQHTAQPVCEKVRSDRVLIDSRMLNFFREGRTGSSSSRPASLRADALVARRRAVSSRAASSSTHRRS